MARKQLVLPAVPFHGIADRGKGVGRTEDGMVVFAEGVVPGDVADIFVQKKKGGFAEGRLERLVQPSPDRIEPFCQHFSVCGGCKWQNLDYATQLRHKHQSVVDAFERIAKVPVGEMQPILGSPETVFYRNKLEFAFASKRWLLNEELNTGIVAGSGLGFHKAGAFDKVIDIEKCWLQTEPSNALRNAAREIALEQGLDFYDVRRHTGFLRNMMVRLCTTGEIMVLFSFAYDDQEAIQAYLSALLDRFPTLTTLVYCINDKLNDTVFDREMIAWHGKGYVIEQLGSLRFKIGPKSFFQTNSRQAKALYDTTREFAGLTGNERVFDLYTGTGSIALYVADLCKEVIGIEEIPEAIEDAKENQLLNNIDNAVFYVGDVRRVLSSEFIEKHGKPDVVITDPPRAGMHEKAILFLLELAAPRIVYVSCNPATQARDIQLLSELYRVVKVRPVDMFPHTHHIENVALLELK
ncbi:MAG: 23S rRNA (uracil(1939)-C(5))-methyltransferase RlmD [Chitinophagales bacterium]|jgi:23S rRNA (uracil1939-C5)-methyltransferase